MRKIKFATALMIINLLFWAGYNTYFGWNKEPINEFEKQLDYIYKISMYFAWAIYFLPLLNVYTTFIKNHEKRNNEK